MNKDFLDWELTNILHSINYDGDTFLWIDDENDIISDSSVELIGGVRAILYSQAFRWFRENYGGYHGVSDDSFLFEFTIGGEFIRVTSTPKQRRLLNSYEEFQEACLREMIEIVKAKQR